VYAREHNDSGEREGVDHTAACHHLSRSPTIDQPALKRAGEPSCNGERCDDPAGERKRTCVLADDEDDPDRRSALGHLS
jgi:hypothetical protein